MPVHILPMNTRTKFVYDAMHAGRRPNNFDREAGDSTSPGKSSSPKDIAGQDSSSYLVTKTPI